jgi:hypothetical protein
MLPILKLFACKWLFQGISNGKIVISCVWKMKAYENTWKGFKFISETQRAKDYTRLKWFTKVTDGSASRNKGRVWSKVEDAKLSGSRDS